MNLNENLKTPKSTSQMSGKKRWAEEMEQNPDTFKWWRRVSDKKFKPLPSNTPLKINKDPPKTTQIPPILPDPHPETEHKTERNRVFAKLVTFREKCRELLRINPSERVTNRIDCWALKELRREGKISRKYPGSILGSVPGIEVGDRFHYRTELVIAGLHSRYQHGIDYKDARGRVLATCVVATEGYSDRMGSPDELIYMGEGGTVDDKMGNKGYKDQEIKRGNLALKNSMVDQSDVRVVRGIKCGNGTKTTYVYDGLYRVKGCDKKKPKYGNYRVFEFKLVRQPGQPTVHWHRLK